MHLVEIIEVIVSANLLFTPRVTIVEGLKILTECHHFVSENSSNNARGIHSKVQQGNRSAVLFFFYKINHDYFDQTAQKAKDLQLLED